MQIPAAVAAGAGEEEEFSTIAPTRARRRGRVARALSGDPHPPLSWRHEKEGRWLQHPTNDEEGVVSRVAALVDPFAAALCFRSRGTGETELRGS